NNVPKAAAAAPSGVNDYLHLAKDLLIFSKQAASLAPSEAAKQWLALFDRSLALRNNPSQLTMSGGGLRGVMDVLPVPETWPDLVTLLGQAKAEPLLLRALLLSRAKINSVAGMESYRLARKLALANIDKLQQPPWSLTESLDGSALYEALLKKFPADPNNQNA